jgi:CRP-like cAMP-binding protein
VGITLSGDARITLQVDAVLYVRAAQSQAVAPASELRRLTASAAQRNHLLATLASQTLAEVVACAEHVRLPERSLVYEAGEPITHVDFPMGGLIAIVAVSREGNTVEVGPVGCDGVVGLPVFLDGETDPLEAFVQVGPLEVLRMSAGAFQSMAGHHPDLQQVMRRYVQWTYYGMAQWILCAELHPLEERMGRWLSMCQDRLGQAQFALDREYLGQMLGVRPPSVMITVGALRKSGLIEYERGVVTILDRPGLDQAACECNRLTAAEYRRLIGRGPQATSRGDGGRLAGTAAEGSDGVTGGGRQR